MKSKYFIISALIIVITSCFADKGNYEYTAWEEITVTGIESDYTAISQVDRIQIEPVVSSTENDAQYEYYWGIYETSVQGYAPIIDTIATTKNLDYLVVQPAKGWVLVFYAKNINTGYSKIVTANLNVVTEFTRGWYVAKQENGYTDLDLFLTPLGIAPDGKRENIYSQVNGKKLKGDAKRMAFFSDYKALQDGRFVNTRSLFVLSSEDASVVNISTLKEIRDFNSLFFTPPSVKAPDFVCDGSQALFFINDGLVRSIYTMSSNTGQFGVPHMINSMNSPYRMSKYFYTHSFYDPIFFDEMSSTFYSAGGYSFQLTAIKDAVSTQIPSANNNKTLVYMGQKAMNSSFAILKDKTNPAIRILATVTPSVNAFNIIADTLNPESKLFDGENHTLLNGDENMMYFSNGKEIWSRNLSNKYEQLQYTLPADETVSFIKHRKYSVSADIAFAYNFVIVASKKGDSYVIRMFEKTSGNLAKEPIITMTDKGEAGDIIYIAPRVSSYTYPNSF